MPDTKIVLLVRFKTPLSLDEVMAIASERADEFRALAGLQQKYYLHDAGTGEVGGLYIWESAAALDDYRKSELRASIASAYKAQGEPRIDVLNVMMTLR